MEEKKSKVGRKWLLIFILPLWVYASSVLSQFIVTIFLVVLDNLGVSLDAIDQSVLETVGSALIYLVMMVVVIGLPWLLIKSKTNREELGLSRLPSWLDIIITPAGLIVYVVLSAILMIFVAKYLPSLDVNQVQELGFRGMNQRYEYTLAFLTLVVLAPIAEEVIFRGYLFGKLKKYLPMWISAIIVSVTFGLIHGQWNLAIDTFALSMILCLLRQITGNLWAPILLHMAKNGIAYYILFINPIINSLG